MPLTPADTYPTFSEEVSGRIEDALDDLAQHARLRPFTTVAVSFVLGFLLAKVMFDRWLNRKPTFGVSPEKEMP